ncbi:MAG: metalloprotease PmbA [Nevskiaceae bacterium]|nr:MAG: metalloprotease PmbA [Nevskiaceae bacterium]TBR73334.1 MAG: metalloprotease PmbA [Nevskiaceae bacterium]
MSTAQHGPQGIVAPQAAPALPGREQLEAWTACAAQAAQAAGADAHEVVVSASRALSVSVRLGKVESVQFQRDRELAVSVYYGQRSGSASTSDVAPEAIRETVQAACAIARASEPDPCSGLPDADQLAREFPDLDLCHPWAVSAEAALELARECEAQGMAVDPRVTASDGAGVDTHHACSLLANSLGFCGYRETTHHSIGCSLIAEADGVMEQGGWYASARASGDLEPAAAVGQQAGTRAAARLGARKLAPQRTPVVFDASLARGLFGQFCSAISGGTLYRRASFLVDQAGTAVFSPGVNLRQQPFLRRGPASAAWDREGVATRDRELVAKGVLQGYLLGSYSARQLGLATTGNAGGVYNLVAEPTAGDQAELLKTMGRGFLVTDLMGQGVNLITGDYSRGAAGFWVENGEIAYPVSGVTLAGNLAAMFRSIQAIGCDVDRRGGVQTGSLLIDGMTIAS